MILMQGDCLERMKQIDDGYVHMILCDLPYGVTQNKWDSVIPFKPLWDGIWRVCKENAAVVLFSQMPFTVDLVNSCRRFFRYEWIYEKTNPTGFLNAHKMPMRAHETVLVFYKRLPTYNPIKLTGFKPYKIRSDNQSKNYGRFASFPRMNEDGSRYPRSVLRFSNAFQAEDKSLHPTQKPIALCEYMVRTYTNPGDVVLDMCMGSGTTGVACANTEREFVGIEKDHDYFIIAQQRIVKRLEEIAEHGTAETENACIVSAKTEEVPDPFDLENLMNVPKEAT